MTSIISSMLKQLFHKTEYRCLTIGLDAAGKTTMLYKMKLGEVVTTIPTIGFNVETVEVLNVSLTIWDVGGCDKIRPLWRHYYQNTQALIFIADVGDTQRFDEVQQLFVDTVSDDELRDAVILMLFNKIDLVSPAQLQAYKTKFLTLNQTLLSKHVHHVEDCCAPKGEGIYAGYEWLATTLPNAPKTAKAPAPQPTEKDKLETQLEEWLSRPDEPDEVFLSQLADYTLDSWDHYTHLRIAYIMLRKHGRREGMSRIFSGIKAFIENSPRTRRSAGVGADGTPTRGTTFHETMTYFWTHMVHYALESSRIMKEATTKGAAASSVTTASTEHNEWKVFLLMNPQLANGGLFLHYYSKQRMLLDPDSRVMVLLPDKVPLPSLLVDANKLKSAISSTASTHSGADAWLPKAPLTDGQFLDLLVDQQLPGWGHEVKLRVIYLLLCRWGVSSKSDDAILEVLQGIEKAGFHYSINYFWIQLVTYHIAVEGKSRSSSPGKGENAYFCAFNDPQYVVPKEMTLFPSAPVLVLSLPPPPPLPSLSALVSATKVPGNQPRNEHTNVPVKGGEHSSENVDSGEGDWVDVLSPQQPEETAATTLSHSLQAVYLHEHTSTTEPITTTTSTAAAPASVDTVAPAEDAEAQRTTSTQADAWLARNLPFSDFLLRPHCQPLRNPLLYGKYYSRKVLDAEASVAGLSLPDLKQFPSVV